MRSRAELIESVWNEPDALAWSVELSEWSDQVVVDCCTQAECDPDVLAVLAVGGYGRQELCPYSDLDLCVIPSTPNNPDAEQGASRLHRLLHGQASQKLQVSISLQYLPLSDLPGADSKTLTTLLDSRLIWGNSNLLMQLLEGLRHTIQPGAFLISKFEERSRDLAGHGDSPLAVELDLKHGAGGTRAFNFSDWCTRLLNQDRLERPASFAHIHRVRCQLQALAGRQNDRLSVGRRSEIAKRLNRDPFELGEEISRSAYDLHQLEQRIRERVRLAEFDLYGAVRTKGGRMYARRGAESGRVCCGVAMGLRLGLEPPRTLPTLRRNVKANDALMVLTSGESTLRELDRCGLLDRLLPELGACRHLMPRDPLHRWSVFEHTLRAMHELENLPEGSFLTEVKESLIEIGPLCLAILLHDTGKLYHDRPHSEVGAEIADEVARRWGLYDSTRQLVMWLVREHLAMARFIRMRDVMNVETAKEFAQLVHSPERLKCLTILTYCDIRAVSEEAWSPMQETLLQELFTRTLAVLGAEDEAVVDESSARIRFRSAAKQHGEQAEDMEAFADSLPAHFILSTPAAEVSRHYGLVQQAREGELVFDVQQYRRLGVTDFFAYAPDRRGFLNEILGVLYANDISLTTIRASTTSGENPVAIDQFTISQGGRSVSDRTLARIQEAIKKVASGKMALDDYMLQMGKDPQRVQEVFEWSFIPGEPALLEVRAPRGRGLAYRLSRVILEQGWSTLTARLGQWAGKGAAAFYLVRSDRKPLTQEEIDRAFKTQKV